jgi:hypothetical protein
MREPGYYEYVATIDPPRGEDGWAENNIAVGDLYLRGEGKVLVVTGAGGDTRDWEPLVAALKASERTVQVRMAYEFPRDPLSLLPYDLVLFPNVPADMFDAVQLRPCATRSITRVPALRCSAAKTALDPAAIIGALSRRCCR